MYCIERLCVLVFEHFVMIQRKKKKRVKYNIFHLHIFLLLTVLIGNFRFVYYSHYIFVNRQCSQMMTKIRRKKLGFKKKTWLDLIFTYNSNQN